MTDHLIDAVLAFAVVVVVPLAARLDDHRGLSRTASLVARASAVVSLVVVEGPLAAALALPWLAVVGVVALRRLMAPRAPVYKVAFDALPFAYLAVGAAWLVVSRFGARPLGFGDRIVELTALHFHYAGFIAPCLMARLNGWIALCRPDRVRIGQAAHVAVLAATPVTALGIAASPLMGVAGALLFLFGLTAGSALTFAAAREAPPGAKLLLTTSAISVVATTVLASSYALGQWVEVPAPSLPAMAWTHGLLNAFGFAFAGVLGWLRVPKPALSEFGGC